MGTILNRTKWKAYGESFYFDEDGYLRHLCGQGVSGFVVDGLCSCGAHDLPRFLVPESMRLRRPIWPSTPSVPEVDIQASCGV